MYATGYEIEINLLYEILRNGYNVVEVPVSINNENTHSKIRGVDGLRTTYCIYRKGCKYFKNRLNKL